MIESAPEVVNHVSGDGKNPEGIDRKDLLFVDYLSRVRIFISQTDTKVIAPSLQNFPFEVLKIMLGPFDFYAKQDDSIVGRKWHE
jgi:hypothetical protein